MTQHWKKYIGNSILRMNQCFPKQQNTSFGPLSAANTTLLYNLPRQRRPFELYDPWARLHK